MALEDASFEFLYILIALVDKMQVPLSSDWQGQWYRPMSGFCVIDLDLKFERRERFVAAGEGQLFGHDGGYGGDPLSNHLVQD